MLGSRLGSDRDAGQRAGGGCGWEWRMKCNPWRWLWGLFALLPLGLLAIVSSRSSIEADLAARVREHLKRSGQDWAQVTFEAREARIGGRAIDEADAEKAAQVAFDTWGVRSTTSVATLIEKIEKYEWLAERANNFVKLGGFVPNEKARAEIHAGVKASFPTATIEDNMKLARGAPAADVWHSAITFGLTQLAQLKSGQVKLEQTSMTLTGEAATLPAYTKVKTALGGLPKGVQLKHEAVSAPIVRPYTWAARLGGDQLLLGGYVPSQKDREALIGAARSAHPKVKIVDEMQIGAGAPDGYISAAAAVLMELAKLEDGRAELRDTSLSVAGLADDQSKADSVRAGLKKVPSSIRLADQIKYRDPPPPPTPTAQLAVMSPYRTSVFAGTGTVVLSGFVPSEQTRQALIDLAKQRFPNRAMVDQMQLGAGQPEGWDKCVVAGLAAVQRLGNGRVHFVDRRLEITGRTQSVDLAQTLSGDVKTVVGNDCEADVKITLERDVAGDEAKVKAEADRLRAEAEAKSRADAERAKAAIDQSAEARQKAAAVARADADAKARVEAEARQRAEAAAQARAAGEAKTRADGEARQRAEAEARTRAAADEERRRQLVAAQTPPAASQPRQSATVEQRNQMLDRCQHELKDASRDGIYFKRASAEIEAKSFPTLNRLAEVTVRCIEARIDIEGHTDTDGTPDRNQRLSERRAQSVLDYLVKAGISPARLSAIGYGDSRNVTSNETAENKARNRRIEFTVK